MSYRQVNSSLWTGEVALQLAGNLDAWAVIFYILTGPESCASSIGVFRLPISTLAEALGIPSRRASEGLRDACRTGFAAYDEVFKMCWVKEAARHQYGESPNLKDNRVKALVAALPGLLSVARKSLIWNDFHDRYGEPWAHVFEAVGEGLPEGFGRASEGLLDRVGSLDPRSEILDPDPREEKGKEFVGDPKPDRPTARAPKKVAPKRRKGGDLDHQVQRVHERLCYRRRWFLEQTRGSAPGSPPALSPKLREEILQALRDFDADLLALPWEEWDYRSRVGAAGEGLWLDTWTNGKDPRNEAGKMYTEPARAFTRFRKEGAHGCERFPDIFFAFRDEKEKKAGRKLWTAIENGGPPRDPRIDPQEILGELTEGARS